MTAAEIIEGMLDILNGPDRWCKNILNDGQAYCLVGALNKVTTGTWCWALERSEGHRQVVEILDDLARERGFSHDGDYYGIVEFNNAAETEYEDIRMFLKEALERVS